MTYVPDATIGTMITLDRAKLAADTSSLIAAASAVGGASLRTGARLRARDLEFPEQYTVVTDHCDHRLHDWKYTGSGRPVVFEGDPAPVYTSTSPDDPHGAEPLGNFESTTESQSFINTVAVLPVPAWTAVGATTPLSRLARLSVTVAIITNDETLTDDLVSGGGVKQFNSDAEVAAALAVRAHRISYSGLRQHTFRSGLILDTVSDKTDAWECGKLAGMRARQSRQSHKNNVPVSALPSNLSNGGPAGGSPLNKSYHTFQCTALLAPGQLALRQNLAPGDAILVSITGPDRLIYAGRSYAKTVTNSGALPFTLLEKRNIILPVRASVCAGLFVTEQCA